MPSARKFSLAPLTVLRLPPPEAVSVAARAGYKYAGVRFLAPNLGGPAYPLMDDPVMLRETLARLADTGVKMFDLELVKIEPDFEVSRFHSLLETGASLGCQVVNTLGEDSDYERLTASFASLCEAAKPFGLSVDLEFVPWTKVPNLASAQRIVAAAAQPNGGVVIDALHLSRSEWDLEQVARLPVEFLHYAQICDAPGEMPATIEAMIHTARCERLLPGDGAIDLVGLFSLLPHDLPIAVEVPSDSRVREVGWETWARRAREATEAVLAKCRWPS